MQHVFCYTEITKSKEEFIMKLADKILNLRKQHGMSQEDLAGKLNVSRQAVSRWEMGSAQPDASNVLQLSKLFCVTADYLLNDDYESDRDVPIVQRTELAVNKKFKKIIGLCISAIGLLGNFVIYIFSRTVKVVVPIIQYDEDETKWYNWNSDYTDHSYKYFVQTYDLEFLTAIFWILVITGLIIAFLNKDKLKSLFNKLVEKIKNHHSQTHCDISKD